MKKIRSIKHYSNDRCDPLMVSVRCLYGMGGYGVYWAIMEMLSMSEGYRLSKAEYASIAEELNVPEELVAHIVEDHGLFVVSDGYFQSKRISEEMGHKEKVSEAKRKAGILGMKSRYNKESIEVKTKEQILPQVNDTQARKARANKYTSEEKILHSKCKVCFDECYKQQKNEDFYWSGKEMKAIVGILNQIRFHMDEGEKDNLDRQWENYQAFIKMVFVKSDSWIKDHIAPSLINSKFNEIYLQLKYGKSERPGKIADADQFVDRL